LKNIDRMIGAGPLMVSETEVVGAHRSKPSNSTFMSSSVAIETPELPDLAVDVWPLIGIAAVERDRIEGRRQALGGHPFGNLLEPPVGTEGIAFAGEHAGRILVLALEGKDPGGERERNPGMFSFIRKRSTSPSSA
jgi:hypothetical protein